MSASLKAVSLFAGAGGMDYGASLAGVKVLAAFDTMASAAEMYGQLLPGVPFLVEDVRSLEGLPDADLLLGGYPCQPFSSGGIRSPVSDERSNLWTEFARVLRLIQPRFFVAENVSGLRAKWSADVLQAQLEAFDAAGYQVSTDLLQAADFGVPQRRRRLFIVGVHKDLKKSYRFPESTHSVNGAGGKLAWVSHGDAIAHMEAWPSGEFYELSESSRNWPWYYMSRNRRALWAAPAYTVVANFRHVSLHPRSPQPVTTSSNLADGSKQTWEFQPWTERLLADCDLPVGVEGFDQPRRLSWRESAVLQTFPECVEPAGSPASKMTQIGNAVPPHLAEAVVRGLVDGSGLGPAVSDEVLPR